MDDQLKLERQFDEILFQISKGVSQEDYNNGIRWSGFERVKEWQSRNGFTFNIYSNDHFINGQPHFHFDNKAKGIASKISFSGEIFEEKGKQNIPKNIYKDLKLFLKSEITRSILVEMWNSKNPELKVKL